MKNLQSGRSMIEMIGVLAIVGVLSVGGLAAYTKAMMQYRISHTLAQISEIASRVSMIGEQASSYAGLSNNVAIKLKAVPGDMITPNSTDLTTAFSGDAKIESSTLLAETGETSDDLAFTITYTGISAAECLRLAAQDWKSGQNSTFIGIGFATSENAKSTVASSLHLDCKTQVVSNSPAYAISCAGSTALQVDEAMTGCNCTGDTCIMVVKYY